MSDEETPYMKLPLRRVNEIRRLLNDCSRAAAIPQDVAKVHRAARRINRILTEARWKY